VPGAVDLVDHEHLEGAIPDRVGADRAAVAGGRAGDRVERSIMALVERGQARYRDRAAPAAVHLIDHEPAEVPELEPDGIGADDGAVTRGRAGDRADSQPEVQSPGGIFAGQGVDAGRRCGVAPDSVHLAEQEYRGLPGPGLVETDRAAVSGRRARKP